MCSLYAPVHFHHFSERHQSRTANAAPCSFHWKSPQSQNLESAHKDGSGGSAWVTRFLEVALALLLYSCTDSSRDTGLFVHVQIHRDIQSERKASLKFMKLTNYSKNTQIFLGFSLIQLQVGHIHIIHMNRERKNSSSSKDNRFGCPDIRGSMVREEMEPRWAE